MESQRLWKLINEAWDALNAQFEPVIERHCVEHGIDLRTWGLLLAVLTFEPEETTPAHLMVRNPYAASEIYMDRMQTTASKGYLEASGEGSYRLSGAGRELTHHLVQAARRMMARLDPLPAEKSEKLAQILNRMVEASLNTPPPPELWSIRLSNKLMPGMNPAMPFIEQAFSCLAAYRDDAHLAAWRRTGLSATALESLTLLWRGDATSLDTLCHKLAHRGHDCRVYVTVLEDLRTRGFLQGPDHAPRVTSVGRVFRNQVEEDTDRYFYAPWSCLDKQTKDEMSGLLMRMKDGLLVKTA